MSRRSRASAAIALVDFLALNPESTRGEAEAHLSRLGHHQALHHLVAYVREAVGDEVLTTRYDKARRAYVYALALTRQDGTDYVVRRRMKVRNEVNNLVDMCDRMTAKFGDDGELRMVRAMLSSVVTIMDASAPPPQRVNA